MTANKMTYQEASIAINKMVEAALASGEKKYGPENAHAYTVGVLQAKLAEALSGQFSAEFICQFHNAETDIPVA